MKLVGIDVGKNSHHFCVMDKETGEFNVAPSSFSNNKEGFDFLINSLKPYSKKSILLGMEDTGHYHVALLKFLLSNGYTVALINPKTTELTRKMEGGITNVDRFDLYEQRQLTLHHHNLKEETIWLTQKGMADLFECSIDNISLHLKNIFKIPASLH